jgi:hypothetical protein
MISEDDDVTYVEVKTTIAAHKHLFEVSVQELLFALHAGSSFHVYRVAGAFSAEATVVCIPDLVAALEAGRSSLAVLMSGTG